MGRLTLRTQGFGLTGYDMSVRQHACWKVSIIVARKPCSIRSSVGHDAAWRGEQGWLAHLECFDAKQMRIGVLVLPWPSFSFFWHKQENLREELKRAPSSEMTKRPKEGVLGRMLDNCQQTAKGASGKGPRQKTSKIVKKCQEYFRHFSTFFAQGKTVKKCQKYFRHFLTIFARHPFSGPFWGALKLGVIRADAQVRNCGQTIETLEKEQTDWVGTSIT